MTNGAQLLPPYINGRFVDIHKPQGTYACHNPARPTDILGVMGWTKELVEEVVCGMAKAQPGFEAQSLDARIAAAERLVASIRESAEEMKSQMMLELSRSKVTVEEEWRLCESLFAALPRYCREQLNGEGNAQGWNWTHAPVGLVLVSSTVALPLYTILSALLPALVAGNAVAIKPSSHCPLSSSLLASCIHQAQLQPGLVQLVYGDFEVFRRLLLTHKFDVVLYTGGEETREQIRKDQFSHDNTRLVLCTAGKNAAIVLPSADIDRAVSHVLYGMCADAGQRVESTSLLFVESSRAEELIEKLVQAVKTIPIGARETLDDQHRHVMGPLCSADARERFLRFQGIAYRECEETLRWGKSIDNPGNGFFVSPGVHLLKPETFAKSVYASTPFFGPDIAIVPVSGLEQAVTLLGHLKAVSVVSVHTQEEKELREVRKRIRVPFVYWNRPTTDLDPELPQSGRGHPDNTVHSGLGFLRYTVYAKTLVASLNTVRQTLFMLVCAILLPLSVLVAADARADYRSSVEGNEVVKGKFYPKAGRFQFNLVQGGLVMNQSFIDTYLYTGSITYHVNEWHAVNFEGLFGFSQDRYERKCVESFFYNDKRANTVSGNRSGNCDPDGKWDAKTKTPDNEPVPEGIDDKGADSPWQKEKLRAGPYHLKPAYMPIREIKQVFGVNYQWTPVYGKALWFLSAVGYVDFFSTVGLGVTLSDFYPRKTTTLCDRDTHKADSGKTGTQCDIKTEGTSERAGAGDAGRPAPEAQSSPTMSLGIGSRFYLGRVEGRNGGGVAFLGNLELRNFSVFGSDPNNDAAFMNFFALWGGAGILF